MVYPGGSYFTYNLLACCKWGQLRWLVKSSNQLACDKSKGPNHFLPQLNLNKLYVFFLQMAVADDDHGTCFSRLHLLLFQLELSLGAKDASSPSLWRCCAGCACWKLPEIWISCNYHIWRLTWVNIVIMPATWMPFLPCTTTYHT